MEVGRNGLHGVAVRITVDTGRKFERELVMTRNQRMEGNLVQGKDLKSGNALDVQVKDFVRSLRLIISD